MNKKTAIIFFGIILAGLIFSLIYLNTCGKAVEEGPEGGKSAPEEQGKKGETPKGPAPADPKGKGKGKGTAPAKGKSAGANAGQPESNAGQGFSSPEAAMKALAEKAGEKNFAAFTEFVGKDSIPESIRPGVKQLIEDPAYLLDAKTPYSEISKSATGVRWALNFVPDPGKPDAGKDSRELYTDLESGENDRFSISRIVLPLAIGPSTKVTEASPGDSPPAGKPAVPEIAGVDPLTIAHAFSKAVVGRNFEAARALADPATVTDERVAALLIAIEEGGFSLRKERPLVVTLSREDITWVLTRIQSKDSASEFALELGQAGDAWAVNGLTFSKVLAALADRAGGGDVAYSPIVEDPMGGDSLVLYFEFDEAGLSTRANRQLAIIADILSQGSDRAIRINGHADALGTDAYNAQLSDRRAAAIRKGLISMGVEPRQIITEGFGESKPRRPNFNPDGSDNPSGRSQNRRAQVYLDF